jgi:cysteine desulfurase/selenocysteine lyase
VSFSKGKEQCAITWNALPWKFEAGTPHVCGVIALMEAVKYLERIGMAEVLKHENSLAEYAVRRLQECSKVTLHGPNDLSIKCGIIPFTFEGLSSHDVALFCDNYGIMMRSGFHCAQPLHQVFKLQSSTRASFYIYNIREEIDPLIEVLKEMEHF